MELSRERNVLAKDFMPNINSSHHCLYFPELVGIMTDDEGLSKPNVDEYERRGKGVAGVDYAEQSFKDQPFTNTIEYNESPNRILAILTDQVPDYSEGDTTGLPAQAYGGEVGLDSEADYFFNKVGRDGTKFESSYAYFYLTKIKWDHKNPHTGSSNVSIDATARRGFVYQKPIYFEGWGYLDNVTSASTVPDAITTTSLGSVWLRPAVAGDKNPKKAWTEGGAITHVAAAANPRIDLIVAYEETRDQRVVPIVAVEGAELAIPVKPTPADVKAAIDAITGMTDTRWCIIAAVAITVAPLTIVAGDITMETIQVNALSETPILVPAKFKTDAFYKFTYMLYARLDGDIKQDTNNIGAQTVANFNLAAAHQGMLEAMYLTEPIAKYNVLEG